MPAADPGVELFSPSRVFADVKARLSFVPGFEVIDGRGVPGSHDPGSISPAPDLCPAAVLVGLIAYPGEVTVLLTVRSTTLRVHSGQIAFPGGRIEASDASPTAAALREAQEEIGLDPSRVEPLGCLAPYATGTGFRIVPVVARVAPPFALALNPHEVEDTFEVPFGFLMNSANHALLEHEWNGDRRLVHAMPYAERYIWGVTAGILRNLYERLYC